MVYVANNTIGGVAAGEGNVIASNGFGGVLVSGSTSQQNAIQRNSIFENALLGIDLAPGGKTVNDAAAQDADEGANRLQNFPEMSSAVLSGSALTITYAVPSSTTHSKYPLAVEFFLADAAGQEGQTFLGADEYLTPGTKTVVLAQCCLPAGVRVVATATDANGNTSEFSSSVVISAPLLASTEMGDGSSRETLDSAALTPLVWQAIAAWESAGLDAVHVAALRSLSFDIQDLPGRYVGLATPDRIVLDLNAAGYGWYVEGQSGTWTPESEIADWESRIDLLTAVLHEMGHVVGLADEFGQEALMADQLQPGIRRLPTSEDLDKVFARGDSFA